MKIKGNKKIIIACDLFLNLQLYNLPPVYKKKIQCDFPLVDIIPVNIPPKNFIYKMADIYWGNRINENIIKKMPNLKWIHFGSVGVNHARNKYVFDKKIIITNSKGLVVEPMTASAISFIFSLARGFHRSAHLRHEKKFGRKSFDKYFRNIEDVFGQKCLIVGYGDVGKSLARILKTLDVDISVISRSIIKPNDLISKSYLLKDLDLAVTDSDYVINLLPLNTNTRKVFNAKVFSQMKKNSFFINIGRGETVEQNSLIEVLNGNKIAGAGLDVFENEPLSQNSELIKMKNVIITPHVAGLSKNYWKKQYELFVRNLNYFLNGEILKMQNIIDMKKEY